jgi:hypothetical protein
MWSDDCPEALTSSVRFCRYIGRHATLLATHSPDGEFCDYAVLSVECDIDDIRVNQCCDVGRGQNSSRRYSRISS